MTSDAKQLSKEWKAVGMPDNDELAAYIECVGKVMDVEEDDTLQVQWYNHDTFWLPVRACMSASSDEPLTQPAISNSWLEHDDDDDDDEHKSTDNEDIGTLFGSVDDRDVRVGTTVQVTRNLRVLRKEWKRAELGPIDALKGYLGAVGKVMEIEEDDDTVKVRWQNLDEFWLPVRACRNARGKLPTVPAVFFI